KLVAHRLMDEKRRHGRIHPARERADYLARADLLADGLDSLAAICGHGPLCFESRDAMDEVLQQLRAIRRMSDFRMELDSVEFPPLVCDCREGGACRGSDDLETGRQCRDAVAMAHPHLVARSLCPDTLKQRAILLDFQKGAAELAVVPCFHLAAELRAHGLLAITDAEH